MKPFNHWQNAKYTIAVVDFITNIQPNWISIDQQNEAITINTSNIFSVQDYNLLFSAKLITFSNGQSNKYTTQNFAFNINMENNNWELVSSSIPNYLSLNQISNFTIQFQDEEDDNVRINIQSSTYFVSFVKYLSSNNANILIMPEGSSGDQFDFSFIYTDSYHLNSNDWQLFTKQMILFASQPPVFDSSLNSVNVNQWQDYLYVFPKYSDPDSLYPKIPIENSILNSVFN